jgi:hypothetical protein
MVVEKDIKVQDWMVESDVFSFRDGVSTEKSMGLENWMIEGSWNNNKNISANAPEAELKVEDWMLKSFKN